MTWGAAAAEPIVPMMMRSHEAVVDYMMPLGLNHLFATGHHYGPGPWVDDLAAADWNPVYFHEADRNGRLFRRGVGSSAPGRGDVAAASAKLLQGDTDALRMPLAPGNGK
ncbi:MULTISPECIES: hypothetical protein [unclassified Sphingomonas]|uniref:hypothetical protein n=1 Tax=unclassified Sphingomonas TaxID=196159 RepID=UPI0022858309|nr:MULTISPECIES: hypothetical protein [unclassified Sphingomonas]